METPEQQAEPELSPEQLQDLVVVAIPATQPEALYLCDALEEAEIPAVTQGDALYGLSGGPGADGWWSTGDIGFLDEGGDLFIVDRAAEVVVVAGFSVYPSEVEAVVGAVPDVAEVAVIGVPDDATGSTVVAYVRAPGADPATVVDAVRRRGEAELAGFKRPSRVEVVDELPTTLAGRVRKGDLRQLERRRALGILE